ncbi:hypothetical protein D5S17_12615 [Pseudonocardiaceae bacterium YIM PH 21723]|nr:hypothetical protein D5S17_12615 [Pseudonocardiaceae bacterium YIM PH 21723]
MSSTTELAALQRALNDLHQCVGALRVRYGDAAAVRRIANAVERLGIDVDEFTATPQPPSPRTGEEHDMVLVSDTPYDPELWRGADDEGVGGYRRHQH